ncbi:aldehyde dehydrogenase [Stipitochalara longipes BDJ]|nr:aldehyde dehydrogenase [Stipitochalara longipes BDJ]
MLPGNSEDSQTTLGCLINEKAVRKVELPVKNAVDQGAEIILGGKKEHGERGTFYPATISKGMNANMEANREGVFGPVVSFFKFDTEEEVLELANEAEVGLASYVFTDNLPLAWRMTEALQTGIIEINTGIISDAVAPFWGIKHSGFGREREKS